MKMQEQLWFDVESRYEATSQRCQQVHTCCGLMQNQDMKQLANQEAWNARCCGLMQNQDMKQLSRHGGICRSCCGMMQNQDTKQLKFSR